MPLLPDLYEVYDLMPYDGARDMEVELAIGLREEGYGVWRAKVLQKNSPTLHLALVFVVGC